MKSILRLFRGLLFSLFGQSEAAIAAAEGDTYLSPKEISMEMEKYDFYNDPLDSAHTFFVQEE